jgi:hypothetical protein
MWSITYDSQLLHCDVLVHGSRPENLAIQISVEIGIVTNNAQKLQLSRGIVVTVADFKFSYKYGKVRIYHTCGTYARTVSCRVLVQRPRPEIPHFQVKIYHRYGT